MYYWAKYFKQDVTIVIKNRLQHWVPGVMDKHKQRQPHLESEEIDFLELRPDIATPASSASLSDRCPSKKSNNTDFRCYAPYRDYAHFAGTQKPWQQSWHKLHRFSSYRLWVGELKELNEQLHMGIDFERWDTTILSAMKDAPLGTLAKFSDRAIIVNSKHDFTEPEQ